MQYSIFYLLCAASHLHIIVLYTSNTNRLDCQVNYYLQTVSSPLHISRSTAGFSAGAVVRYLCGEKSLGVPVRLRLPLYDEEQGQMLPFRTLSMVVSLATTVALSVFARCLFVSGAFTPKMDVFHSFSKTLSTSVTACTSPPQVPGLVAGPESQPSEYNASDVRALSGKVVASDPIDSADPMSPNYAKTIGESTAANMSRIENLTAGTVRPAKVPKNLKALKDGKHQKAGPYEKSTIVFDDEDGSSMTWKGQTFIDTEEQKTLANTTGLNLFQPTTDNTKAMKKTRPNAAKGQVGRDSVGVGSTAAGSTFSPTENTEKSSAKVKAGVTPGETAAGGVSKATSEPRSTKEAADANDEKQFRSKASRRSDKSKRSVLMASKGGGKSTKGKASTANSQKSKADILSP